MPLMDTSSLDISFEDQELASSSTPHHIRRENTNIYVNHPPEAVITRQMVESKIAAYERSINSRTINNQPNNQAPVIQPTLYLRPEELHQKKTLIIKAYSYMRNKYNPRLP